MPGITYSYIGFIAIAIHCTINREHIHFKKYLNETPVNRALNRFLWAVLLYYITDSLWGIFSGIGNITLLYIDTFVYYIAMSLAVVLWSRYVAKYLGQNNVFTKVLKSIGMAYLFFELLALIVNIFYPFFFYIDADVTYHAGAVRYISLYIQIGIFIFTAIQTAYSAVITKGPERRRNYTVFMLGLAMIIAIIIQILYPLIPAYSVGYLIGCCILHTYVEEDEKEEKMLKIKSHADVISSMAGIYFCSYFVDMTTGKYYELDNKITENDDFIKKDGDARETLDMMCNQLVLPQYKKEMQEFTNMDTLDARLVNKKYISIEFEGVHTGWTEGLFISGHRDENGKLTHAIWALRTIHDQKEKEKLLLYNSYVDELTGIYNRKMFEEDISENMNPDAADDFVLMSMDVNGLKKINDSLGHAAGDELIKGAAQCMRKMMQQYGKVYRTGGDEFIALLNIPADKIEALISSFKAEAASYKGRLINGISISCGYIIRKEHPGISIPEMSALADKKMYEDKHNFYVSSGLDRRTR